MYNAEVKFNFKENVMKKNVLASVLILSLVLALVGCGKKEDITTEANETASIPQEIVQLVNVDLPSISADRDSAVAEYNSYFAESEGDTHFASLSDACADPLTNQALVSYDAYLVNLAGLQYSNPEVQSLKDTYQKSAELQREAIQDVVDALTTADFTKIDAANDAINDSMYYLKQYEDNLQILCNQYGVQINGEFVTATLTDAKLSSETDASSSDAE